MTTDYGIIVERFFNTYAVMRRGAGEETVLAEFKQAPGFDPEAEAQLLAARLIAERDAS